jgi:hypothetical protein
MAKRVTMLGNAADTPEGSDALGHPPESLEQRVQRLEDAVATLQDTGPLEDRVVERLSDRLGLRLPGREPERRVERPVEHMVTADRRTPLPVTDGSPPEELDQWRPARRPGVKRHSWLLFDLIAELRAMVGMFFDVRYHIAWSTRLTVLILLALILTSGLWSPLSWIPIVSGIIDKVVDLILAFCVYHALSREVRRYREIKGASSPSG